MSKHTPSLMQQRVLDAMLCTGGTLETSAMRHMGVSGMVLGRLHTLGWVEMVCVGLWRITDSGRIALALAEAEAEEPQP